MRNEILFKVFNHKALIESPFMKRLRDFFSFLIVNALEYAGTKQQPMSGKREVKFAEKTEYLLRILSKSKK